MKVTLTYEGLDGTTKLYKLHFPGRGFADLPAEVIGDLPTCLEVMASWGMKTVFSVETDEDAGQAMVAAMRLFMFPEMQSK